MADTTQTTGSSTPDKTDSNAISPASQDKALWVTILAAVLTPVFSLLAGKFGITLDAATVATFLVGTVGPIVTYIIAHKYKSGAIVVAETNANAQIVSSQIHADAMASTDAAAKLLQAIGQSNATGTPMPVSPAPVAAPAAPAAPVIDKVGVQLAALQSDLSKVLNGDKGVVTVPFNTLLTSIKNPDQKLALLLSAQSAKSLNELIGVVASFPALVGTTEAVTFLFTASSAVSKAVTPQAQSAASALAGIKP